MSRTRIVKGNITKITGGNYKVYSKEDIENIGSKVIQVGKEGGVIYGDPEFPPLAPQTIQLIVQFRPHKDWKGEFGFDWFRLGDTMLFNDVAFKDVVAYQYSDYQMTKKVDGTTRDNWNKKNGYFKVDANMLNELKQIYKPFTIPWKNKKNPQTGKITTEEYYIPWMSLLKDKEAKISFFAEIKEPADYLEFPASEYFTFTPNKMDIKGKKSIALNTFDITVKCIKEFTSDQTIELKAYKKDPKGNTIEAVAGKINVWANDASKQKVKDVVFVEIKTKLSSNSLPKKSDTKNEKERINNYLIQAYIKLSDQSDIVELDLAGQENQDLMNFITNNKIDYTKNSGGRDLQDYLKMKLKQKYNDKYDNHFKAFYFAEAGYKNSIDNLAGYSEDGADYVVAFSSRGDQTATHEFLHSMGLAHTFTNKDSDPNALFTYDYQRTDNLMDYVPEISKNKRRSLYYWQWKIANNSIIK